MSVLCGCSASKAEAHVNGCDIVVLGLEGAGKTMLVRRMQAVHDSVLLDVVTPDCVSTIGTELQDITCPPTFSFRKLFSREVGGPMLPLWPQFFADARMIVFVIDVSARHSLASATVELYDLLQAPELQGKPIAVVLNKTDAAALITRPEINLIMKLPELKKSLGNNIEMFEVSALTGDKVPALLTWLMWQKSASLAHQADPLYH